MRRGYEVYAGYLPGSAAELEPSQELVLPIKEMARLETRLLRARVSDTRGPGWEDLWVRQADGTILGQPLAIQILGETQESSSLPRRRDIEVSSVQAETMGKVWRWGGPRYARYAGDALLSGYFIGQPIVLTDSKGP